MPLNVLLIAPHCDGTDIGEAWSTYQWVSRLAQRHRVTVLTYTKRDRPTAASQLPGVEIIEWRDWPLVGRFERLNSGVAPGYIGFYRKAKVWLSRALRGRAFDVVHQLSPLALRYPTPAVGIPAPLIMGPLGGSLPTPSGFRSEMRRSPWFTRLRAVDHLRLRYDPLLRRSYESAAVVLGVAPYVRDLLAGLSIRRFEVMSETGVVCLPTSGRPDPQQQGRRQVRLLFVGRVVRAKGVRDAIRAMVHLSDLQNVTLDVVGDGDDLAACEQEAIELGVCERVCFHGRLPRAEIDPFYASSDVLLFPSLREPSGNAVLEAMAHGLALIVADNGGPAYAVDDRCGIRVRPETPAQYARDLAAAVRRLAGDPGLLAGMKSASRCRAAEIFLWEKKVDWMCRLYQDVLATRRRNGKGDAVARVAHVSSNSDLEPES